MNVFVERKIKDTKAPFMNRDDIAKVIKQVPSLNYYGIGSTPTERKLPKSEREARLRENQKRLLDCYAVCEKVCEWLASKAKTKSINERRDSYGLKHMAQRAIGRYVPSGVFIAAVIHSGFSCRVIPGSMHVRIGISERSLNDAVAQEHTQ